MNLYLYRKIYTDKSTIGELYIDGKFYCFTLEDVVRTGPKVGGATAIPAGTYNIDFTFSNRFKKYMFLLLNVPNFEGVRIHCGNTELDTEGCILVGDTKNVDSIGQSRTAFDRLWEEVLEKVILLPQERVSITIMEGNK